MADASPPSRAGAIRPCPVWGDNAGRMPYVLLVLLLVAVVAAAVLVQRRAGQARARIEAGLAQLATVRRDTANFYGLESGGPSQVRGIGALALTDDELVFLQFVPEVDVRIPRAAITGVEIARSFLDKAHSRDLLVVTWSTGTGDAAGDDGDGSVDAGIDRAAFDVKDIHDWRVALLPDGAA